MAALVAVGLEPVVVDHGTTFPEAVDWLHDCERDGIPVWYHGGGNPRDLWSDRQFQDECRDAPFVVTDPDTVPDEGCPADWPQRLLELAVAHGVPKVGLGLRIDDIPAHYPRADQVRNWERQYWERQVTSDVRLFDAGVDTTLAVYQPLRGSHHTLTAYRTGEPYTARHLAWYEDPAALPEDVAWYYSHLEPGITFWTSVPGRSAWGN